MSEFKENNASTLMNKITKLFDQVFNINSIDSELASEELFNENSLIIEETIARIARFLSNNLENEELINSLNNIDMEIALLGLKNKMFDIITIALREAKDKASKVKKIANDNEMDAIAIEKFIREKISSIIKLGYETSENALTDLDKLYMTLFTEKTAQNGEVMLMLNKDISLMN